jgi:hypothetical protein
LPGIHKYVPVPEAVKTVAGSEVQRLGLLGLIVTGGGLLFTVTVTEALPVHPFASVTVTVYVVFVVGFAVTVAPLPFTGPPVHTYVVPLFGVAESVVVCPEQTVCGFAVTVTVRFGFNVIVTGCVLFEPPLQPGIVCITRKQVVCVIFTTPCGKTGFVCPLIFVQFAPPRQPGSICHCWLPLPPVFVNCGFGPA